MMKEEIKRIRAHALAYHLKVYGAPPLKSSLDNIDDDMEEETKTMSTNFSSAEPSTDELEEARKSARLYAEQRRRCLPVGTRVVTSDEPDYVREARESALKFAERRNQKIKKN